MSKKGMTQNNYSHQIMPSSKRIPSLPLKSYSFQDPLFQSFGNGYQQKQKLSIVQRPIHNKYQKDVLQQVLNMSNKFSLFKSMLKISTPLCNPSVLMVNTQNKVKTEMIVEAKCMNEDEDSQILCQNAKKYLKFLDIVKEEEQRCNLHKVKMQKSKQKQIIKLESRIQNSSSPYEQSTQVIQKSNEYSNPHQTHTNSQQTSNKDDTGSYQKTSLINQEHSKYLTSYQKESQLTYNSQKTDQLFQKIQTPRIYSKQPQEQRYFTAFEENSSYNTKSNGSKCQSRKVRKFEKSPPSSAVLQTKKQKVNLNFTPTENTHNQKLRIQNRQQQRIQKGLNPNLSNLSNIQKKTSRKSSLQSKDLYTFKKQKNQKQTNSKINQKFNIVKNQITQPSPKNLALKAVDKTNQFQKMLRMASSRINE